MIFQDPARRTVPITGLIASLILLLQVTVLAADEPSVGDFNSREFPVLAKLGHGDVRGPQELSRFARRYELVFHR